MALNFGEILGGIGAAFGGTAPQYVQGLKEEKQSQLVAREKAMYQDAAIALQLFETKQFEKLDALGMDRMDQLKQFSDAVPNDTLRMLSLNKLGMSGDLNARAQLHAELISANRAGQVKGYLSAPEQIKGVEVAGELRNPYTGALMGAPAIRKRETMRDANDVERYVDNGEPVFADITKEPPPDTSAADDARSERTSALTNIRSEVDRLNKTTAEIVTSYNKVMSLEPSMRDKVSGRGAINAAIMNVARLISPGVVTDRDAAAFSGASKTATEIMNFLSGKGVDMNAIMTIVDPTNPETFNVDALLDVARNVTSSAFPSIQAQFDDQKRIAEIYKASDPFMRSYFNQGKLQEQANAIMSNLKSQTVQQQVVDVRSEEEALKLPLGTKVRFPDGQEAVVEY